MITGSLQKKKGLYYAVLNLYDDYGKRKPKWIPTGYTIKGNKKKAEEKLEQFKIEYEQKSKIKLRDPNIYDKYQNILFCDYMLEWLEKQKGKVEQTTYIGYEQVIKGRLYKYFKAKKIKLVDLINQLKPENQKIKVVSDEKFYEYIKNKSDILGIINDLTSKSSYNSNIIMKNDFTINYMKNSHLSWPTIDKNYINKFFKKYINKGD